MAKMTEQERRKRIETTMADHGVDEAKAGFMLAGMRGEITGDIVERPSSVESVPPPFRPAPDP